jgi:hypothetical protein
MKESVTFYSEGTKLVGDIYLPDTPASGPCPGIVLCGGYTGVKEVYAPDFAARLAEAGYASIAFDYKGWGSSEGPANRLDPYGRVWDAFAALTLLADRDDVDGDRIGVLGWSYGGATAIWLAATDPRIRCVSAVVTIGNGRRWMEGVRSTEEVAALNDRSKKDRLNRLRTGDSEPALPQSVLHMSAREKELWAAARAESAVEPAPVPLEFIDETMAFHPEWVVDKIAPRPLLLVATEMDGVTPPEESQKLYDVAGEPRKLVMIPDCGHFEVYTGAPFDQTCSETVAWFDTYL